MKTFDILCDELEKTENSDTKFDELAEYIFNHCCLEVENSKNIFHFSDIEFYYESPNHQDKFRHNADEQISRGEIYWHPSGIDITIGNGEEIKGGILIRGILEMPSQKPTGPQNILSYVILPAIGINNTRYGRGGSLKQGFSKRIFCKSPELEKVKHKLKFKLDINNNFNFEISKSARIGLDKGHFLDTEENYRKDFKNRKYRYFLKII